MEPILHTTSLASATAVSALFSAIWEGTVLVAFVALCLRLLPGLSAAARSAIWMSVFLLLVLLHVLPEMPGHWAVTNHVMGSLHASPLQLDLRWSFVLAGLWAALSLWRGTQLTVSAIRLHRMANRATPVAADAEVRALLEQRDEHGRIRRPAMLCTSNEVERPSVFGFFRPRILVPPELLESLSPQELRQVVVHEMEHLRRADDWTNLLQKVGLALFPLNPALLWVERRLCAERELACDDRVLRSSVSGDGRKAYALCLTRLAEYSMLHRGLTLVLGAWERRPELARRVHRILRRPARPMGSGRALLASASLVAGALACALALARSPQLVSFAAPAQASLNAHVAEARSLPSPSPELRETNLRATGGSVQLVKAVAVMPQRPSQSSDRAKPIHSSASKRSAAPRPAQNQQAWVVLTSWEEDAAAPQVVFAVAPVAQGSTPNIQPASYAVVRLADGWLVLKI
jgi:beta-lactamase regulating signal transducer with metallopeptidase domain